MGPRYTIQVKNLNRMTASRGSIMEDEGWLGGYWVHRGLLSVKIEDRLQRWYAKPVSNN